MCRRRLPSHDALTTVRAMNGERAILLPARSGLIALALLLPR
jgi:hypothetical protein